MDAIKFVKYFNLIKPNFEEIKESISSISKDIVPTISDEIVADFAKNYDLKLTSLIFHEDAVVDLIQNTNVCDTRFSVFNFYDDVPDNSIIRFATIDEKGDIFFDSRRKMITFQELEDSPYSFGHHSINQTEFLEFFLKYLEIDFNRSFRKNSKIEKIIDDIELDAITLKNFPVFKELLSERGN